MKAALSISKAGGRDIYAEMKPAAVGFVLIFRTANYVTVCGCRHGALGQLRPLVWDNMTYLKPM